MNRVQYKGTARLLQLTASLDADTQEELLGYITQLEASQSYLYQKIAELERANKRVSAPIIPDNTAARNAVKAAFKFADHSRRDKDKE